MKEQHLKARNKCDEKVSCMMYLPPNRAASSFAFI